MAFNTTPSALPVTPSATRLMMVFFTFGSSSLKALSMSVSPLTSGSPAASTWPKAICSSLTATLKRSTCCCGVSFMML